MASTSVPTPTIVSHTPTVPAQDNSIPSWMRFTAVNEKTQAIVVLALISLVLVHGLIVAVAGYRLLVKWNRMAFPAVALASLAFVSLTFIAPWQLNVFFTGGLSLAAYLLTFLATYFLPIRSGLVLVGGGAGGSGIGIIANFVFTLVDELAISPKERWPIYDVFIISCAAGLLGVIVIGVLAHVWPRRTVIVSTILGGAMVVTGAPHRFG